MRAEEEKGPTIGQGRSKLRHTALGMWPAGVGTGRALALSSAHP